MVCYEKHIVLTEYKANSVQNYLISKVLPVCYTENKI